MRTDGRMSDALRPVTIERNYTKYAQGSVLVCFGDTKVLCTAFIENRIPSWLRDSGKGWVTAEYGMLPGATHQRNDREANRKGRAQEISRLIGRSLRAVVDLTALGECQITVDCDVLQADGGTRTAAITGAYVALHDALASSVCARHLSSIPISSGCAAVSVGMVNGEAMLDLCYEEDARAEVDMNVVMDGEGRYIEIQGCAERTPFSRVSMQQMMDLAEKGNRELIDIQKKVLEID